MTLFLAGGIAWALKRAEEVPNHVRAEGLFWEVLTYKHKKSFGGFTPEEIAEAVARGRALRDQMVLEFPNLAIAFHPVPDEENGFLQVIEFANSDSGESSAPRNLRKLVDEKTFDVAHAEQLLNEHADLEAWKSLMMKDYSPQRFARVMRGEWHIIMEHFLCLCAIDGKGKPFEDLEQLARVMSSGYSDLVSRLESMDMQKFYKHPGFALS